MADISLEEVEFLKTLETTTIIGNEVMDHVDEMFLKEEWIDQFIRKIDHEWGFKVYGQDLVISVQDEKYFVRNSAKVTVKWNTFSKQCVLKAPGTHVDGMLLNVRDIDECVSIKRPDIRHIPAASYYSKEDSSPDVVEVGVIEEVFERTGWREEECAWIYEKVSS